MNKKLCIQQAHLDGWERCRRTMMARFVEMIEEGRISENVPNSVEQIEFAGCNPTIDELDKYQDGGWREPNAALVRSRKREAR